MRTKNSEEVKRLSTLGHVALMDELSASWRAQREVRETMARSSMDARARLRDLKRSEKLILAEIRTRRDGGPPPHPELPFGEGEPAAAAAPAAPAATVAGLDPDCCVHCGHAVQHHLDGGCVVATETVGDQPALTCGCDSPVAAASVRVFLVPRSRLVEGGDIRAAAAGAGGGWFNHEGAQWVVDFFGHNPGPVCGAYREGAERGTVADYFMPEPAEGRG